MIKTLFGAAILVATLSTGAQALTIGATVSTDAQTSKMDQKMMIHHKMMMHNHMEMKMMHCEHFMHRAHGKCVSMNKMHKMKQHMMIKY